MDVIAAVQDDLTALTVEIAVSGKVEDVRASAKRVKEGLRGGVIYPDWIYSPYPPALSDLLDHALDGLAILSYVKRRLVARRRESSDELISITFFDSRLALVNCRVTDDRNVML